MWTIQALFFMSLRLVFFCFHVGFHDDFDWMSLKQMTNIIKGHLTFKRRRHYVFFPSAKNSLPLKIESGFRVMVVELDTTFNNYICGGQFYWWRKPEYPERTTDLPPITDTFITYCCIKCTSSWAGFELTKLAMHCFRIASIYQFVFTLIVHHKKHVCVAVLVSLKRMLFNKSLLWST